MSVHVYLLLVHSMLPEEEALKSGTNGTHLVPLLDSAIMDRDGREREEKFARYVMMKRFPVCHMEKPEILKHGRFRPLLITRSRRIATAMCLKKCRPRNS